MLFVQFFNWIFWWFADFEFQLFKDCENWGFTSRIGLNFQSPLKPVREISCESVGVWIKTGLKNSNRFKVIKKDKNCSLLKSSKTVKDSISNMPPSNRHSSLFTQSFIYDSFYVICKNNIYHKKTKNFWLEIQFHFYILFLHVCFFIWHVDNFFCLCFILLFHFRVLNSLAWDWLCGLRWIEWIDEIWEMKFKHYVGFFSK